MATVANGFELPGCLKAAAAIEADLAQLTTSLTEAQFHAPPRTGGWSIGQSIEHLVLTGQAFLPKWDMALKDAARNGSHGEESLRYSWWQRKILHYAENPSKLKHKTAPRFVPYSRRSIEETVGRFLSMHRELVRRMAEAAAWM